jgi:hypothetical protein
VSVCGRSPETFVAYRGTGVAAAVGEADPRPVAVIGQLGDLAVALQRDAVVRLAGPVQHGQQVTAVHDGVRVPVAPFEPLPEVDRGEVLPAVRVHEHQVAGADGQRRQLREHAEAVQDAQRVRGELDPGADLAELR